MATTQITFTNDIDFRVMLDGRAVVALETRPNSCAAWKAASLPIGEDDLEALNLEIFRLNNGLTERNARTQYGMADGGASMKKDAIDDYAEAYEARDKAEPEQLWRVRLHMAQELGVTQPEILTKDIAYFIRRMGETYLLLRVRGIGNITAHRLGLWAETHSHKTT